MAESTPAHILIVDDEPEVRRLLEAGLKAEGYAVSEAADGASLLAILDKKHVDLITLDVRLGGEDGFNLAREVRATNNVPIIMISGKGDTIDRVVGLELGADDYIAKPFQMREVLARIRAVLRRYENQGPQARRAPQAEKGRRFEFDGWLLDAARRALTNPEGKDCELTTAEFNLLLLLVERPGACCRGTSSWTSSKGTTGRRWIAPSTVSSPGCARRSSAEKFPSSSRPCAA